MEKNDDMENKNYFISLSYKDQSIFFESRSLLPKWINPIIFPAKDITPDEMISDELFESIRQHDGLIYLSTENSSKSFWVALERDYAIRIKKPVYNLNPINKHFDRDLSQPMKLKVFPSYTRKDKLVVDTIIKLLRERHFDMFTDDLLQAGENFAATVNNEIISALDAGGYSVFFISKETINSEWVKQEFKATLDNYSNRIIPVIIDNSSITGVFAQYQALSLYDENCQENINRNKLDGLIVLLYWKIYQNTRFGN
jgi:hypothetical protein